MNLFVTILLSLFIANPTSTPIQNQTGKRVEIVIEGSDQMRFNLSEITVSEGDTVVLTLKHVGKLPKAAMGHNWVLLAKGTEIKSFATSALQARDNEYIPKSDNIIAHTALLGGGEETTIEFVAPAAGEYDFICSFPGHYALMNGKFIVK